MTWADISASISKAFDVVQSLGLGIINLLGKGRVDETEVARMKFEYEKAVQQLNFSLQQAELWLAEKMMVNAPWIKPLSLATGGAIIFVCAFNLICHSLGWGTYSMEFASTEMLILLGMFVYVTSGSNKLLMEVVEWLISIRKAGKDATNNKANPDSQEAKTEEK